MLAGPTEPLGCHPSPRLICSSQGVSGRAVEEPGRQRVQPARAVPGCARGDGPRGDGSRGDGHLSGWFGASARGSSGDVPSPLRYDGLCLRFAQDDSTVLCQILGGFGRAAMAGAGAVPGQALSVPSAPG